jgi:phospholipid/cholesterol/gamma-HCH transport system substrate-binding protein
MVKDTRQRRRVLYGSLLIAGMIGLAFLIFFLDDLYSAFEKNYSITALVPDAPGISPGTPVWIGGKEVGAVLRVAILPTSIDTLGRIAVTLELPEWVREQVRADSRVRLTAVSMMSEAVIDILPGSAAAPVLQPGDTIRQAARLSAAELANRAAALRTEFDTVAGALRALEPAASERMEQTRLIVARLDGAMQEVQQIRADLDANPGLARLREPEFQASLQRARAHAAELPGVIASARQRADGAGEVRAALARLQLRADTLAAQLDAAAAVLQQPEGFVGRFQQDTALIRAVGNARASLDSLIAEARRNPLRFVF